MKKSLTIAIALVALVFVPSAQAGTTERGSVSSTGVEANGTSFEPAVAQRHLTDESGAPVDGFVLAFHSAASNLVPNDSNAKLDVFVRDASPPGSTNRVSLGLDGDANADSFDPAISMDGRFVAFTSNASNLVAGDTNGGSDIFIHDRELGTTERVSVGGAGQEANDASLEPAMSSDGRFVAFTSYASNLVAGDTNGVSDVFVRDRELGTTERVSVDNSGGEGDQASSQPSISDDGRFVAFTSLATLGTEDTNGTVDVFRWDRNPGETIPLTKISVGVGGAQADGASFQPAATSGVGVVFSSAAANLVAGDTNAAADVFLYDPSTGATERISVGAAGAQADGASMNPTTGSGGMIAFSSVATNLVDGDTNGLPDVFLRHANTGVIERVSVGAAGAQGNGLSLRPSISLSAIPTPLVAFVSAASNLVAGDANNTQDVFVHKVGGVDSTPPVITCPNMFVNATAPDGAVVTYAATATGGSGAISIAYSPPSERTLPIGTHTVTATATDAAGNTASCTFTVTVNGAAAQIEQTQTTLAAVAGPPGTPLADKIDDALDAVDTASDELAKQPPDRQAALGALEGAAGDIEAAVKDGLLDAGQATPILEQLAAAARLLAVTAIAEANAAGGDPATIAQAEQALAAGDGQRSAGAFKDAINRYKDALAKAESA
jgi:Tol biopolymer transport system component